MEEMRKRKRKVKEKKGRKHSDRKWGKKREMKNGRG